MLNNTHTPIDSYVPYHHTYLYAITLFLVSKLLQVQIKLNAKLYSNKSHSYNISCFWLEDLGKKWCNNLNCLNSHHENQYLSIIFALE